MWVSTTWGLVFRVSRSFSLPRGPRVVIHLKVTKDEEVKSTLLQAVLSPTLIGKWIMGASEERCNGAPALKWPAAHTRLGFA